MTTPASKSQLRALGILGLSAYETYDHAAAALEANGYRKDGIPMGLKFRDAAKLSDTRLIAGIKLEHPAGDERIEY